MNRKFQWLAIAIGGLALVPALQADPPVNGNGSNHPAPARPAPRSFSGVSNAGYRGGGYNGMNSAYRTPVQRYGGAPVYPGGQRFSAMSPAYRSPQFQNFGSARTYPGGQRFSSMPRTDRDMAWRQMFPRNVQPRSNTVTINGARASAGSTMTNVGPTTTSTGTGSFQNTRSGNFSQPTGVNRTRTTTQNHVFARRSADWQSNWDRSCDHFWRGHLCRFVNNSWVVFDFGFIPWWPVGYPFDYGYGYGDYYPYPYAYDPGYYGYDSGYPGGDYYNGQGDAYAQDGGYQAPEQPYVQDDSPVAAAQERLSRMGYYHGKIDGVFGPETQRAVRAFQSDHGLNPTGYLTMDTRRALGLGG
jgi:Putative peptidoglycan binding domain